MRGFATGSIFISYRREDSAAYAGRLCDHLNALAGAGRVFMDVEDIAPGQRFEQAIDSTIAHCDVALIVIGPRWAETLRKRAQEAGTDYVRREIESALDRQITIVPVLVGGAGIAELSSLPGKLAALAQYEAAELRDGSFGADCARLLKSLPLQPEPSDARTALLAFGKRFWWSIAALALTAALVAATGWMGIGPLGAYRARQSSLREMLATAHSQMERSEFESAFRTYQALLKVDPSNRPAIEGHVDAAMRWVEEFHVVATDSNTAEERAASLLAEIFPVLDAGLARAAGRQPRAANILAHIGWAHWLNRYIAAREAGPAGERDMREALRQDPTNVFAHAMLGNLMLQNGESEEEALRHLRAAIEQNRERPFVRRLQLGVLIYPRDPETRVELIRVANDMRRNGEPLDEGRRRRILSAYSPTVNSAGDLRDTLSAVPPADAWATYLWLDNQKAEGREVENQRIQHDFIHAGVLELEGKRQEALTMFQNLQGQLKRGGYNGRIADHVAGAIARLSASRQFDGAK